jgi:N-acetylmuramoyl-L-alanine amidase
MLLGRYGYNIEANGHFDDWTRVVLRSFQLHFRPERVDGRLDRATLDTLTRLLAALPVFGAELSATPVVRNS